VKQNNSARLSRGPVRGAAAEAVARLVEQRRRGDRVAARAQVVESARARARAVERDQRRELVGGAERGRDSNEWGEER
jgi:hypothetical protein